MGIKSKPKMPPPDPMEIELANIGRDVAGDYQENYRPMNEALISKASVDRSNQAAGRGNVDAQMATSNQLNNAILRGGSTGGFGGAGSISLVDAGATGGALQSASAAGYGAGRQNYAQRLGSAVDAVQAGQDTAAQGLRTVAGISSRDALASYNHEQAMNRIEAQGIAQTIGAIGQGYFAGQSVGTTPVDPSVQPSTQAPSMQGQPLGRGLIDQGQNYLQRINPRNRTIGA